MLGQFIIIVREGFEAVLIISLILAYLDRIKRRDLFRYVWYGISIAVLMSLVAGSLVWLLFGTIPIHVQGLFEGIVAWLAAIVISWMVYWMATRGRNIRNDVLERIELITTHGAVIELTSLSFLAVFREGMESVLFLIPFFLNEPLDTLIGSFLGGFVAFLLAYLIFNLGLRIDLHDFFYFTSILLLLLAGGLVGYGTHEIIEYLEYSGVRLGWLAEDAYVLPITSDSPMHHKNVVGSILAVMFGYSVRAEWARVILHLTYLAVSMYVITRTYRKNML
ncbi:MAG: ferrous iron transporter [Thermoproteota archaeon]|nr:MAG: ferrous iron transporter [Candidatus Korarchaeota archaeon]